MTPEPMTCDRIDALLPDFLEEALEPPVRLAVEAHLGRCVRCAGLVRDIASIRAGAAALPELAPARDLWPGIAGRIAAPVIPLGSEGPARPARGGGWRRWATAAALVVATAGVTYVVTTAGGGAGAGDGGAVVAGSAATGGTSPATVLPAAREAVPASVTYGQEIAKLRTVLDVRRQDLDPATVAVVEHSLATVDSAIAEARRALAQDSASAFLMEQLNEVLRKKLGLLRTVALLPARS
jgi:hypothetical protein